MDTRKSYLTKIALSFGVSFLLMLWVISTAKASSVNDEKPYRVETFSVSNSAQLEVKTSGGHITVKGSGSNQMRVEMYVSKNGKNLLPADTNLDEFDIRIEQDGNHIYAIADRENSSSWKFWKNNNMSISFVVYAPTETSSNLKTSGGHIATSGLNGNQDIKTSGGHLQLADLQGTIHARTSGGHINITHVSGNVEARTSGGHINAKHTKGQLSVRTSGGSINLEDIAGAVEASTSGGGISADIVEMGEFAKLKTSGGNVNITVPRGLGLNLDLHGNRVRTNLENFSGSMEDDDVEGTINGGGSMLSARTSGGSVRVSFK